MDDTKRVEPKWHRRRADRPSEILEAAFNVFVGCGVSAATFDQIASLAGVSRGTVYLYFKNKEQIFTAVARHFLPTVPDMYSLRASLQSLPVDQQLRKVLYVVNAAVLEPRTMSVLRLIAAEAPAYPRIAREYRAASNEILLRPLVAVMNRGMAAGQLRNVDPYPAARLALSPAATIALWGMSDAPAGGDASAVEAGWRQLLELHSDLFVNAMVAH